jgi:hypothetical protein
MCRYGTGTPGGMPVDLRPKGYGRGVATFVGKLFMARDVESRRFNIDPDTGEFVPIKETRLKPTKYFVSHPVVVTSVTVGLCKLVSFDSTHGSKSSVSALAPSKRFTGFPSLCFPTFAWYRYVASTTMAAVRQLVGSIHFWHPELRVWLYQIGTLTERHKSEVALWRGWTS